MGDGAAGPGWERLPAKPPFSLEATVRVLQRRPSNLVDVWDHGCYRRALRTSAGLALTETRNCGTTDQPDVRFVIRSPAVLEARSEVGRTLRRILGMDLDPEAMRGPALREPALRAAAQALRGMRPPRFAGLFEAFCNVIPFQQLTIDAGVATVNRIVQRFGERMEHDRRVAFAFPAASSIAKARVTTLRTCGLSTSKANTLRGVARMILSGDLDEEQIARMETKDALRTLIDVPGIGPWSAALVLLRGFGRLDVFPPGDVGATRGLRTLLQLKPGASLDAVEARFGKFRGYLYFHSLGASLLAKGLIQVA